MTATDPRTLDALLRTSKVRIEPRLGFAHDSWCNFASHQDCCGRNAQDDCNCGAYEAQEAFADIEAERDRARTIAVALEQECADKDRRIAEMTAKLAMPCGSCHPLRELGRRDVAEAAALLSDALLWHRSETDNTAVAVQEALALLTREAS